MFGDNLRKIRKHKNLTQKELAELLGVSDNGISNWEKGVSRPDIDQVVRICEILSVSPTELITPEVIQSVISPEEKALLEKYGNLDFYGKKVVDTVLDIEYERCQGEKIKIAARNGISEEKTITDDEKKKLFKKINEMPDVPE